MNNDYRFNSLLLWEQLVKKEVTNVVTSGNVGANALATWTSEWFTMRQLGSTIRAEVFVPGSLVIPATTNSRFSAPDSLIYTDTFVDMLVAIETQGNQYRAIVRVNNPYGFVIPSPNRTLTFTMKEYLPPRA